ncbi:MAG TPA: hypothetical protein PLL94_01795 [Bacteroidales bacterium]|nr:MAG: hypothetical protein BWX96_00391 [Bacteroidetes bacterium ADurb.Bin145]HOU01999.1 hypothetical protein [Bacteroidales bacterium]HQK66853.1 hypothetical protein [Bacteroidales bacterium]
MKNKLTIMLLLCLLCIINSQAQNRMVENAQSPGNMPPQRIQDEYWPRPQKTYDERKALFLDFCSRQPDMSGRGGISNEIARLASGNQLNDEVLKSQINTVYRNEDTNEFILAGLLRLYYLYKDTPLITDRQKKDILQCLKDFKYWYTEPGFDGRCYWTENHEGAFHSVELLAGQLLKDEIFTNNRQNGRWHMQHALDRLEQWIDWRIRFGWSEWLAHSYYEVDLMTLCNLYDFAEDKTVSARAGLLIDGLLFEMALHNFQGVFASSHGRTYTRSIKGARGEGTLGTMKLIFGVGVFTGASNGTVSLATSSYRCPEIIQKIANDYSVPLRIHQRQSIDIKDAYKYGLSYCDESFANLYLGIQDYAHPAIVDMMEKNTKKYRVWLGGDYEKYRMVYDQQVQQYGKIITPELDAHAMTETNIETYKTADYSLSCAQEFRPGSPGYQQHIWQATLGIDATVFTNHPGSMDESSRPNYWAGNGILPKAAQYKNVLFCIYDIPESNPFPYKRSEQKSRQFSEEYYNTLDQLVPADPPIPFTHAYFPRNAFDEVIEKGNWIFGKKGDGYIALYSRNPTEWNEKEENADLIAKGRGNIWIVEMGSKTDWKDFSRFVTAISKAKVNCEGLNVIYNSPSLGEMKYGWSKDFQVKGEIIPLDDYLRFDNPFSRTEFASDKVEINYKNEKVILDFKNAIRETGNQ